MNNSMTVYILTTFLVTYTIRVLPLTLIRKQITNKFIKSFLYYVPYVTLAVMTFPAIITSTNTPISGVCALIVGVVLAWRNRSLLTVAAACCIAVFIIELFV